MSNESFETYPRRPPSGKAPITLSLQFDADPHQFDVYVTEQLDGIDSVTLRGRWDRGHVQLTEMRIVATDGLTADNSRVPIGRIRDEIIFQITSDPEHADIRAQIAEYASPDEIRPRPTDEAWQRLKEQGESSRQAGVAAKKGTRSTGRPPGGRPSNSQAFWAFISDRHIDAHHRNAAKHNAVLTADLRRIGALGPDTPELAMLPERERHKITPDLSPNTVKTWRKRAREEGWIDAGEWGLPGPALMDWVQEHT